MGARASRELSESQNALRQTAAQLQMVMKELEATKAGVSKAKELESKVSMLTGGLEKAKRELESNTAQLRLAEQERVAHTRLKVKLDDTQEKVQKMTEAQAKFVAERQELEKANLELLQGAEKILKKQSHPVLGVLLADMGHKLIYRADPITLLAQASFWRKQRAYRPARAQQIGVSKLKNSHKGWPGTITVCEVAADVEQTGQEGHMVIVDGQHRLGACSILESKGQLPEELRQVTVEVYPAMKDSMIKDLFTEINKCEPVLDVDLPEKGASDDQLEILSGGVQMLRDAYPNMFKESQKMMRPHLNVDFLRNELYQAGVLDLKGIKSEEQLFEWLQEQNKKFAEMDAKQLAVLTKATPKMMDKVKAEGFYLGLSTMWIPERAA